MSVLRRPIGAAVDVSDYDRAIREIAIRVCAFANGTCACRTRERICNRAEGEAAAILKTLSSSGVSI